MKELRIIVGLLFLGFLATASTEKEGAPQSFPEVKSQTESIPNEVKPKSEGELGPVLDPLKSRSFRRLKLQA